MTTTTTTIADGLGRGGRVRPLAAVRQTATMAWRSLVSVKHNPLELVDYSITPIMFVFLFTYVFGGQMAGSPRTTSSTPSRGSSSRTPSS